MKYPHLELAVAGFSILFAGCANVPPSRGAGDIDKLIAARGTPAPTWPAAPSENDAADVAPTISESLDLGRAVTLAFQRNVEIREAYARLGIAQADVLAASRIGNPTIAYANKQPSGGGPGKITWSLSIGFTDLLLLPMRSRLASESFNSTRDRLASTLIELQVRVETTWYEYVSAVQLEQMRDLAATAADNSAEYAQRLYDAGNISKRALAMERAAATEARIDVARAKRNSFSARAALAALIGVRSRDGWSVTPRLPAPLGTPDPPEQIVEQALRSRLDLSATRREITALEGGLRLARQWRWLGDVDLGYEREDDGSVRFRGPSFAWRLPIFSRNADGLLRVQSELESARARLSQQELAVRNEVALELDQISTACDIAESYRTALVPLRESIVQSAQEETNFMLIGAFELLQAKRGELDAYAEYLGAVRDYWLARVRLRRAIGERLPRDDEKPAMTLGVEEILAPNHSTMHHGDQQ